LIDVDGSKAAARLKRRLDVVEKEIKSLEGFRLTRQLQRFRNQLIGERNFIKRQIQKTTLAAAATSPAVSVTRKITANKNRSEKMKRSWRYFRAIQENYYPDMSVKEIRSMFTKQRKGMETEIQEVVWRNPSP
jgi:hypothetical protein